MSDMNMNYQDIERSSLPKWAQDKIKADFQIDRLGLGGKIAPRHAWVAGISIRETERTKFPRLIKHAKLIWADVVEWYRGKFLYRVTLGYDRYRFKGTGYRWINSFDHEPSLQERLENPLFGGDSASERSQYDRENRVEVPTVHTDITDEIPF